MKKTAVERCAEAAYMAHSHECRQFDLMIQPKPYDHLDDRAKKVYTAIAVAVLDESKRKAINA